MFKIVSNCSFIPESMRGHLLSRFKDEEQPKALPQPGEMNVRSTLRALVLSDTAKVLTQGRPVPPKLIGCNLELAVLSVNGLRPCVLKFCPGAKTILDITVVCAPPKLNSTQQNIPISLTKENLNLYSLLVGVWGLVRG